MPLVLDLFYIQFLGNTFRFHTDFTLTEQGMEFLSFFLSAKLSSAQSGHVARKYKIPFVGHLWRRGFFSHKMWFWTVQHQACSTVGTEGSFNHLWVLWLQIQPQTPCLTLSRRSPWFTKPVGSQWLSPQVVLVLYTIYLLHCQDSAGVCVLVSAPRSPCLQLSTYLWCCEIQSQPKRTTIQQASHRVKPRLMFVLHTHAPLTSNWAITISAQHLLTSALCHCFWADFWTTGKK